MANLLNKLSDVTTVDARQDLYDAGYDEDGGLMTGYRYVIVAETPHGFRWAHSRSFMDNLRMAYCEEGPCGTTRDNVEPQVEAFVTKIQAHLSAGGKLNPEHWTPIQGSYGSAAYDDFAELQHEREMETQGWSNASYRG